MALFKINKGDSSRLGSNDNNTKYAKEGFAYFTPDTGKFYIDVEGETDSTKPQTAAELFKNRIPLSADKTDRIHAVQTVSQDTTSHTYNVTCDDIVTLKHGTILALTVQQNSLGDDNFKLNNFSSYPIYIQNRLVKPAELQTADLVFMIYDENQNRWNCITNSGSNVQFYHLIEGDDQSWGHESADAMMDLGTDGNFHVTLPNYVEQNGNVFHITFQEGRMYPFPKLIVNDTYTYTFTRETNYGPDIPSKNWTVQSWTTIKCFVKGRALVLDGISTLFEDSDTLQTLAIDQDNVEQAGPLLVGYGEIISTDKNGTTWLYEILAWMLTGANVRMAVMLSDDIFDTMLLQPVGFTNAGGAAGGLLWSGIGLWNMSGEGAYSFPIYALMPIDENLNGSSNSAPVGAFIMDTSAMSHIGDVMINDKTITFSSVYGTEMASFDVPDYRVKQAQVSDNGNYPLLLTPKGQNASSALETTAYYDSGVYLNPSTNTITATKFDGLATRATDADGIDTEWVGADIHNIHYVNTYFENPSTTDQCAHYVIEHGSYYNKPLVTDIFFNGNQMGEPEDNGGPKGHVYFGAEDNVGSYIQADELRGSLDWTFVKGAPSPGNGKITVQGGTGIKIGTGTSGSFQLNQTGNGTITINHANSITSGNFGDSAGARSLSFGGTFNIPYVQYDSNGHITSASTITLTMPANPNTNTTYTIGTGDNNGQIKVTPSNATAYNVDVKGLGSAAFTDSSAYAAASHGTHLTLGTSSTNAFRGDYGNTAYTHSQSTHAPTNAQKNSDITKAEIEAKLTGDITTHTHSAYAAASHGNHVPTTQTADNAKFLRNDNTWATVTPANIGAAAASHGNHVPTTQAADNAKFLRNDNTWATVTPANIGAAPASHGTHLSLGTTSSTAFRGDYGNTAYTHSQSTHAPTNAQKNSDITKAEIEAKLTGDITSHTHSAYAAASHGTHVTTATVKSALGTGTGTTKFLREDGSWATPAYYTLTKAKVEAVLTGDITSHTHSAYAAASHGTHVTAATVKSALGTGTGTTKYLREDGTWVAPPNDNTDTKVKQGRSTASNWRSVLLHYTDTSAYGTDPATATNTVYYNEAIAVQCSTGSLKATAVYGAVWNDYAEYRTTTETIEAGRVVIENGDDTLSLATERLMPGANIVSDTFGFAIGETDSSKTPLAVSGRVLAYTWEPRESFKAGDPVCSGPNGTVSKMTREEVMMYPDRMIGTVSAVPDYEVWGTGNVKINGRIWIKI